MSLNVSSAQICQETLLHKNRTIFPSSCLGSRGWSPSLLAILCKVCAQTHLVDRSKSARTQNLHSLQFCLLQDPQLSLVRGRPTGGQGLHQLTKQTRLIKIVSDLVSMVAQSENIKSLPLGSTFLIALDKETGALACLTSSQKTFVTS